MRKFALSLNVLESRSLELQVSFSLDPRESHQPKKAKPQSQSTIPVFEIHTCLVAPLVPCNAIMIGYFSLDIPNGIEMQQGNFC